MGVCPKEYFRKEPCRSINADEVQGSLFMVGLAQGVRDVSSDFPGVRWTAHTRAQVCGGKPYVANRKVRAVGASELKSRDSGSVQVRQG